jgi:hypothetical protein
MDLANMSQDAFMNNFSPQGSQGSDYSTSPSEAYFLTGPSKGSSDGPGNGPGPIRPTREKSTPYSKKNTNSFRYSVTSDHKPVFMVFNLERIAEVIVALTYNMSFASDLGLPIGSEINFVKRAISRNPNNPRIYWENAAKLVQYFVKTKNPTIMYFQEMNDRNKISANFQGGYQALLELLATGTVSYIDTQKSYQSQSVYQSQSGSPLISYYTQGTYSGNNSTDYGFLAYSIEKKESWGTIYPTVLTIWNRTILGDFTDFYGNDLGVHPTYDDPFHFGRNFSCITTSKGANLINLHGPNDPENVIDKLKPAIENYMTEAATKFNTQHADKKWNWNEALTVIGGDTNDTKDKMKTIDFTRATTTTSYNYKGNAPLSCCAEYFGEFVYYLDTENMTYDTLDKYRNRGDKILVKNSDSKNPIYINVLYEPPEGSGVLYGGRRHSRNLKKRKTIKKRHYKLKNKKSFKKKRIFRRKTRKHTHINNNVIL